MASTRKKTSANSLARPGKTSPVPTGVRYFRTQATWRVWLERNHARETQLWVGFWRVATGKPSITWPQSVDEALCFGWIDGLRRGLDTESYAIRFTPRKATSLWSRVNLRRFAELNTAGLVRPAGHAAREKWGEGRTSGYSYENARTGLDVGGLAALRARPTAWRFWEAQTPSYRKVAGHWVVSAKQESTRARRLASLITACEAGKGIPPLAKWIKVKPAPR
jgi:uncharacterized protein YdeI (YjbR/CyaY-like superfamily)